MGGCPAGLAGCSDDSWPRDSGCILRGRGPISLVDLTDVLGGHGSPVVPYRSIGGVLRSFHRDRPVIEFQIPNLSRKKVG